MAFSDFKTISEVLEKFRITYTTKDFVRIEEIPGTPSEQFLQDFDFAHNILMFLHLRQHVVRQLSFLF